MRRITGFVLAGAIVWPAIGWTEQPQGSHLYGIAPTTASALFQNKQSPPAMHAPELSVNKIPTELPGMPGYVTAIQRQMGSSAQRNTTTMTPYDQSQNWSIIPVSHNVVPAGNEQSWKVVGKLPTAPVDKEYHPAAYQFGATPLPRSRLLSGSTGNHFQPQVTSNSTIVPTQIHMLPKQHHSVTALAESEDAVESGSEKLGEPSLISSSPDAIDCCPSDQSISLSGCLTGFFDECSACLPKCDSCNGGLFLWAEAVWLRARRNDPFAFNTMGTLSSATVSGFSFSGDHEISARIGGGYKTDSNWLLTVLWTHYNELADAQSVSGGFFTYTGPGVLNAATGTNASHSWHLDYDTLDLMGGTVISPWECVDLILSGGARVAWIDQTHRTTISGTGLTSSETLFNDLDGIGPRFGAEGRLYIISDVAFFARCSSSLILAERDEESTVVTTSNFTAPSSSRSKYERREFVPNVELATGVDVSLMGGCVLVGAGYEVNYWFNLGDSALLDASTKRTDISLDGAYARILVLW